MDLPKILIIEDNPDTRRFLETMLSKEFLVITAENGVIGIELAREQLPNLILLDVMLPILGGHDVCSLLKKDQKTSRIPIIFLSARSTITDITRGLSLGADDFIPKPFDYKELLARIHTRLRKKSEDLIQLIVVGDLSIDLNKREVTYAGNRIALTLTEFDILRCLATKNAQIISREEIITAVWTEDSKKANSRTIDVHVRALRKKIPAMTKHIISIYGVGYKYEL